MIGTGRRRRIRRTCTACTWKNLTLKAISAGSRTMLESLLTAMAQNRLKPGIAKVDALRRKP